MKYVKKPIVVEAFQFGVEEEPNWFINNPLVGIITNKDEYIKYVTPNGYQCTLKGDYIIKRINGEISPCNKDIFDATYDVVNENSVLTQTKKQDDLI